MTPTPLTAMEKAVFDTIKQVTRSPRPEDLSLRRMFHGDREVAVIGQNVYKSEDASFAGWMPLALVIDAETAARIRDYDGSEPKTISPEGLEGAA